MCHARGVIDFLDKACGDDAVLRGRVEELLPPPTRQLLISCRIVAAL